jgi:hypothetical protein
VWLCLCLLLSCDRESRRLLCSREFERLLPPSVWPSSSPWSTSLSSCKVGLSLWDWLQSFQQASGSRSWFLRLSHDNEMRIQWKNSEKIAKKFE